MRISINGKTVATLLILVVVVAFLLPYQAAADTRTIALGRITQVDYSNFPDVSVRALIRNGNNEPVPVSDLTNIQILEDDVVMETSYQNVEAGVETMLVADYSSSIRKRRNEIVTSLNNLIGNMEDGDTMGLILEKGLTASVLKPLTTDSDGLLDAVNQIPADTSELTKGTSGLLLALSELENSGNVQRPVQTIIFLSPGIQDQRDFYSIVERAQQLNIVIHTILIKAEVQEDLQRLQELATRTGGVSVWIEDIEPLNPIMQWLSEQRTQTMFQYRSPSSSTSSRVIKLQTVANEFLDESSYLVELQAPKVVIDTPTNNSEQIRKAGSWDSDMELIEPTNVQVTAHVEFPDGYPRSLSSAQFYLNSVKDGAAIQSPSADEPFTFEWNLRQYREPVTNLAAKLKVIVLDELGMQGTSSEVTVYVSVTIPARPTEVPTPVPTPSSPIEQVESCDTIDREDFSGWIDYGMCVVSGFGGIAGIFALGLAFLAVILVIIFRRPIAVVAQSATDKAKELYDKITKPANQDRVGAYLTVLKGEDSYDKPIPLYINTPTPLGRDIRQAEVVFQTDIEHSIISRYHCVIDEQDGIFHIRDYGSQHGTFVNGLRLQEGGEGQILRDGDQIALGPVERGGVLLQFQSAPGGVLGSAGGTVPYIGDLDLLGEDLDAVQAPYVDDAEFETDIAGPPVADVLPPPDYDIPIEEVATIEDAPPEEEMPTVVDFGVDEVPTLEDEKPVIPPPKVVQDYDMDATMPDELVAPFSDDFPPYRKADSSQDDDDDKTHEVRRD